MKALERVALLSMHTSPLAPLGGKKTGGMNVYVREIARFLGRRGVAVDVFTREDSPEVKGRIAKINDNARLVYLPAGPPEFLESSALYPHLPQFRDALLAFIDEHELVYDVVYSHYWLSGWVARALKQAYALPFVQMFHTLGRMKDRISDAEQPEGEAKIPLEERNMRVAVETEIIKDASRLIAATPAEQQQLLWLYRADRRQIQILPPGVDLSHFKPMPRDHARTELGLAEDERMFLFVGRIERLKGIETILQALLVLRQNHPDLLQGVWVHIVGGDLDEPAPEISRLRRLCTEMALDDVLRFVGARGHEVLPTYYNAAEALIMPSDYESFGMVALEAMACGTPVIASEVGGLAFLIEDYETGLHVPVRDPVALAERIRVLLQHPEKRQEMGKRAKEAATAYGWSQIVAQLIDTLTDAMIADATT